MRKRRIDWERNHGKHLHEYTLYDTVKYLAEIDLGDSGIPYEDLKTINRVSVSYKPQLRHVEINYIDKNDTEQTLHWDVPSIFYDTYREIGSIDLIPDGYTRDTLDHINIIFTDGTKYKINTTYARGYDNDKSIQKNIVTLKLMAEHGGVVNSIDTINTDRSQNSYKLFNVKVYDANNNLKMANSIDINTNGNYIDNILVNYSDGTNKRFSFYELTKKNINDYFNTNEGLQYIVGRLYANRTDPNVINLFKYFYDKFKAGN